MKSDALAAALLPFKLLTNKNALSAAYSALELAPDRISGASSYAALDVAADLGTDATFCVDAAALSAVVTSLPSGHDFNIRADASAMFWECGSAKGKLALVPVEDMPRNTPRRRSPKSFTPSSDFIRALKLGGMSCGGDSMESAGIFGIVIAASDADTSIVYSCDNQTLAHCAAAGAWVQPGEDAVVLSPDAIELLTAVMGTAGRLECDATTVYYTDAKARCSVKMLAPLKKDLLGVKAHYDGGKMLPLPVERIGAFIGRANALAEDKKAVRVLVSAEEGRLILAFAETASSSEEYYLIEGLVNPDKRVVSVDAGKLARGLAQATHISLDFLSKQNVTLSHEKTGFTYLIAGKRED